MAGTLDGIRVLDLTRNVAGPYCTMILGDLGAEVIKIERPHGGDDTRQWQPPSWNGYSTTFLALNRNKMSLAVDIDHEDGQEIVLRLAREADVMVESFRYGSLARRGLAYEQISGINPRLVYCSITGFGARGPQRDRPGYDALIQAYSGIMSITGEPERPPVRVGPSIVDMGTGLWTALGILGALYQRERTGRGCRIDTSLLEAGVAWVGYQLAGYMGSGKVPGRMGSKVAMIAPYEAFATKDQYLLLAAPNDQIFARLCRALGVPEVAEDERFRTNVDRVAHREELHQLLGRRLEAEPASRWEVLFLEQQLPCSRIHTLEEIATDPQVEALGLLMSLSHPSIPDLRLIDLPLMIEGQRAARQEPPPELGRHSGMILQMLGYEQNRIEELRQTGVIR